MAKNPLHPNPPLRKILPLPPSASSCRSCWFPRCCPDPQRASYDGRLSDVLEACPVTSTLKQIEMALQKNNLPLAQSQAEKLSEQLERTMPDLAQLADRIAESSSVNQAKTQLQVLEKKMMSDVSVPYKK